jgi:tRNA-dihydrouridine synthase
MFDETGCDGVAIARGALGNPWIFNETKTLLRTGILPAKPAIDEIISTMVKHLELYCGFYGERIGVIIFRKFFHWYSREQEGIRHLRQQAFLAKTKEQMIEMTHRLRPDYSSSRDGMNNVR